MTFPTCHACGADVPAHEDGVLVFCPHCGAPQVQVSENLLSHAASTSSQTGATGETGAAQPTAGLAAGGSPPPAGQSDTLWRTALQAIGIAAVVTAVCALLSAVLAPMVLLTWLWIVISPVVVIGIFHARSPLTPLSAGLGARIGLLTGMAVAAVLSVVLAGGLALQRHLGLMADTDARSLNMLDTMRAQVLAQPGGHNGLGWLDNLHVPEFRAGLVLTGFGIIVCMLLAITTAGGAFAGYARSRGR